MRISIHAPTRGATLECLKGYHVFMISIHAPTRGATSYRLVERFSRGIFQSTLPRGERQNSGRLGWVKSGISIHAPTRGATRLFKPKR